MERRIEPDEWPVAVRDALGPQVVVAGPGAGKTEFLVRRALHLIDERAAPPEQLLLLSFSRRSAHEFRNRVENALDRSFTEVAASTFHSLAFRLLETYSAGTFGWEKMPALLTGPEQVALVHDLLSTEDPTEWPVLFRPLLPTQIFAEEVADFLLRCQEHLIDSAGLAARADRRSDWRAMPGFLKRYLERLKSDHRIDYGTLQAQAVRLLDSAEVLASVGEQFAFILVDEYQDTTIAQARMLERLYRPHRNLTVAGDPYQAIYSFRGAELNNIAEFPDRFVDASGAPARRLVLVRSFRVPRLILDGAVRVTAGGDLPGAAGAVEPADGDGSVEIYGFSQQTEEAEWIASEILRVHLVEGIPLRRLAVLVRSKRAFLPELSRALEQRGIAHDRPDARLVDHPAVRLVLDAVIAATGRGPDRDRAVRRLLLGPLLSMGIGAYHEALRHQARHGLDWPETLRELPRAASLADLIADPAWASAVPAAAGFWELWSSLEGIPELVADPGRADFRHAWRSLSQVLNRLGERDPAATLTSYLAASEDEDFEATPLLGYRAPEDDRVAVTTLHQAKGLEFDIVFIADARETVFPDLRRRDSLLAARLLSPNQPEDAAQYSRFRLQEEMRLAYTAMCRARRRVVWTATASGGEEGQAGPSRFLALVAGTTTVAEAQRTPPTEPTATTPLEAEAALRRVVRRPDESAAARLAALAVLASGDGPLRSPDSFAMVREPGGDTGLLPDTLTLSPSQADGYASCPRRYALERRLHVGDETTIYLAFGTLIHTVLQEVEAGAMVRGDAHATIEEALTALDAHWDPTPYGPGPWAEAWHRRAEATLRFLYDKWPPESAKARALEYDVATDLAGVPWRGRVDRVEEVAGGLAIIDYKTSRTIPTVEEAAESLQLGFYALALEGDVVSAEFWYPAKTGSASLTRRRLELDRLNAIGTRLAEVAAGIAAEDWTPNPGGHCQRCRVRSICPAWPEGREAFR